MYCAAFSLSFRPIRKSQYGSPVISPGLNLPAQAARSCAFGANSPKRTSNFCMAPRRRFTLLPRFRSLFIKNSAAGSFLGCSTIKRAQDWSNARDTNGNTKAAKIDWCSERYKGSDPSLSSGLIFFSLTDRYIPGALFVRLCIYERFCFPNPCSISS